jgi:hypothetical protein
MTPEELAALRAQGFEPDDDASGFPEGFEPDAPTAQPRRFTRASLEGDQPSSDVRPDGMVETGRVNRRHVLAFPEMTGLEAEAPVPQDFEVEDREVRPMSGFERFVDDNRRAHAALEPLARAVGLELPSAQSAANATRDFGGRESASAGDRLSALIPTAPMAPGTESQTDERTRAGVLGLGTGNPVIGEYLDELGGITNAAQNLNYSGGWGGLIGSIGEAGDEYRAGRDDAREQRARAAQQAPGATAVGAAAPVLGLGLAGGPTAATVPGRIGQAAAAGSVLGGWSGAGSADEIEDVPGEALTQGAIGGATAGVLQGAGEGVSRAVPWLGRLLTRGGEGAQDMAAADALRARGLPTNALPRTAYGRTVQRMGGEQGVADALARENVGGRMPSPSSSIADAERIFVQASQGLDDVHTQMAAAGDEGMVDSRALVQRLSDLREQLAATRTGPHQEAAARLQRQLIDPLMEQLDTANQAGPRNVQPMTFRQAHDLRQAYDEMAGWGSSGQPSDRAIASLARDARQDLSGLMDQSIESVSPALRDTWRTANQRWQLGSLIRDNARPQGSQLSGAIAEGVGGMGGGLSGRVARGVVSNYGPALRMRSLQALVPVLRSLGGGAERFAQMLEQSGTNEAMAGTHYLLSQTNPEYRQAIQAAEEQEGQ